MLSKLRVSKMDDFNRGGFYKWTSFIVNDLKSEQKASYLIRLKSGRSPNCTLLDKLSIFGLKAPVWDSHELL